jgi:tetratricopeptide (TPR) repeat protein
MYAEALRIQPDNAAVHFNWGSLLARQGRLEEATSHFRAAVASDAYYFQACLALANALFARGDNEDEENDPKLTREAIQHFEKAAQLNPGDPESHYNYALALAKVHRLSEAVAQCEQFLRLAPDRYDAENAMGAALAWSGRFGEAVPHIERALKLNPQYAQAYFNLAMAHANLGHRAEARRSAQKALELAGSQGDSGFAAEVRAWLDSFTSDHP